MPVEYLGVQCYSCNTFQATQRKKSKKFVCVICHEKQSFRKIYVASNRGKDVREGSTCCSSCLIMKFLLFK